MGMNAAKAGAVLVASSIGTISSTAPAAAIIAGILVVVL